MKLHDSALRALVGLLALAAMWSVAPRANALDCDRDQLAIHTIDGELVAFSGRGGTRSIDLRGDERVLSRGSSGCVAMASTNRRLLAISAMSGAWIGVPYQLGEKPADPLLVEDLVAVAISDRRIIAFDPDGSRIVTANITPRETVTHWKSGASIVAVATDRRVLGFSPGLENVVERPLQLDETIETMDSASEVLTVVTPNRVLTLRTGAGFWSERDRRTR